MTDTTGEAMERQVTMDKLRAWWAHRQGLDGSLAGASAAETLARTGWARSVGGSAPYLGLFARAGASRAEVDAAVARLDVHELPSARGCAYVLPAADYALGLTVGAEAPEKEIAAAVKHLGVTPGEIDHLCAAIVKALDGAPAPLDPAGIKAATGAAARSLGEPGRRRGTSTTLPLALGRLQARGEIRRVPVNGRLDQQRFGYVRWSPVPLPGTAGGGGPASGGQGPDLGAARTELARRYFSWAGPASLKDFRWFSALGAAAARQAVAPLGLVPLGPSAAGDDLLLPPELADGFAAFTVPREPAYALLGPIDGIHLLHRRLRRLLDPADEGRPVPAGRTGQTLGSVADPPCNIVVDRGRLVGLWEFDPGAPDGGEIVHRLYVPPDERLRAAIARTGDFVRDQLGDVRSVSLDSPRSRAPRLAALRAARTS